MKFHNLCKKLTPPPGLASILGYNLKHCIQHARPRPDIRESFSRFNREVRTKYAFRDQPNSEYDPKLYVENKEWEPDRASREIENELENFEEQIRTLTRSNHSPTQSNPKPTTARNSPNTPTRTTNDLSLAPQAKTLAYLS